MGSVRTGQRDLASRCRSIQDKLQAVSTLQQERCAVYDSVLRLQKGGVLMAWQLKFDLATEEQLQ
jgi:hypothetical protein